MKVFIIGATKSGKTTLAEKLSKKYDFKHIKASALIRDIFPKNESDFKSKQEFTEAITKFSLDINRKDPYIVSRYLRTSNNLDQNCIIEGIRNPNDFFELFDIANDKVILLKHENNDLKETEFEKGIEVIKDYLLWNLRVEIIHPKRFHEIRFEDYKEIDRKLDVKSIFNVSY